MLGVTAGSTADVAAITAGADKQILYRASSSSLVFYLPKACLATNSTTQTVNTGVTAIFTFDSEQYDNDTMHDNATNNSRVTFTTAGTYRVTGYALYASNASGYRYTDIRLNGTTVLLIDTRPAVNTDQSGASLVFDWTFSASDYIEMRGFQNSGSNLATTARLGAVQILGI